ncbi:MAG TPA: hypothetical protein VJ823_01490, partial [Rhodanobacteraceae bacterium]|nr:hypothetical protein [Rhodanobacteraceae bacterium]
MGYPSCLKCGSRTSLSCFVIPGPRVRGTRNRSHPAGKPIPDSVREKAANGFGMTIEGMVYLEMMDHTNPFC